MSKCPLEICTSPGVKKDGDVSWEYPRKNGKEKEKWSAAAASLLASLPLILHIAKASVASKKLDGPVSGILTEEESQQSYVRS